MNKSTLKAVFDRCPDAVLVTSLVSNDLLGGSVIYANPVFLGDSGFRREEVEGQPAHSVLIGETVNSPSEGSIDAKGVELTLRLRRKDKTEAPVWICAWSIRDSGLNEECLILQRHATVRSPAEDLTNEPPAESETGDLAGSVGSWTPRATGLTSYARSERLGQKVELLYAEETRSLRHPPKPLVKEQGSVDVEAPLREQHEAYQQLQAALHEKEALLKEIHHRVKNNLQIISSLLRLQAATADSASISVLRESRNRVDTVALLHEHLYQSANLSRISFPRYAKRLITNLVGMQAVSPERIRVNLDMDPIMLDASIALLCGLIINELVYNSLQHAFPAGRNGRIDVGLKAREADLVTLTVGDDGVGIPAGFDIEHARTLGLKLVRQLTRQLKGTLSFSNRDGLKIQITFPAERRK